MSTKIYNAYLWDGAVEELMLFLKELRIKYAEEATLHLVQFSGYLKEKEEEHKKEGKYFSLSSYLGSCINSGLNEPDNLDASAAVYFHRGKIAVQFFGLDLFYRDGKRPMMEILSNNPKLSEYDYWNNVDQPDEVTEEKWDERKDFWDFLRVPCEDGLIYEFSSRNTLWEIISSYREKTR